MTSSKVDLKLERYELARIGAIPNPNSGRGTKKADGIILLNEEPFITVDNKVYEKGIRITPELWAKITTDAHKNSTEPLLQLTLGENQNVRLAVISESLLVELLDCYKERYEDDRE